MTQSVAAALKRDVALIDLNVNMSNALTRAAHSLTLSEKRVIAACIAQCDSVPYAELQRQGAWTVRLSAMDYAETFAVDLNTAYEQLQSASANLFERYIRTVRETRKGPEEYRFRWIGGVKYHKGEGWVELHWWHEVVPHLFGLRKEFTTYKLAQASSLRSIYSWRLFECLKSWQGTARYAPDIEEFTQAMDVPASYLANFKTLRTRVIEPAVLELADKNGMLIEWETRKAGRKVIGLVFKFSMSPQQRLPLE